MSGKDVLRLLLISYGFCRNIEISTYIGDGGCIGYEVSASNDDGIEYYEVDSYINHLKTKVINE